MTPRFAQQEGVLLKNVVTLAILPAAAGRGHAQKIAQIHEMRLRTLAFVQAGSRAACAPFGVEVCEVHECVDISLFIKQIYRPNMADARDCPVYAATRLCKTRL